MHLWGQAGEGLGATSGNEEHQKLPAAKLGTGPAGEPVAVWGQGKVSSSVGFHCKEGTAQLPGTLLIFLSQDQKEVQT